VEVKVLGVNRQKKQIKLSIKALEEPPVKVARSAQKDSRDKDRDREEPEAEKEEPVPTAMEMALREAMNKAREGQEGEEVPETRSKRKPATAHEELEKIFSRTLKNKSGSK
jgi:small subunit ribosomal protein S1